MTSKLGKGRHADSAIGACLVKVVKPPCSIPARFNFRTEPLRNNTLLPRRKKQQSCSEGVIYCAGSL